MSTPEQNHQPRRDFLGKILLGASAFGVASLVAPLRMEAAPMLIAGNVNDATDWFKSVKDKKHKIVFDTTAVHDGAALGWASTLMDTYNDFGDTDKLIGVVVVFRSMGTVFAMNDTLWEKYGIGERVKLNDPKTKTFALRNLFWNPKEDDDWDAEDSIDGLQKRGVMFCVCNHAVEGMAEALAEKMSLKKEEVVAEFKANLFPGIQLVPSGIWAMHHAQELGCKLCHGG